MSVLCLNEKVGYEFSSTSQNGVIFFQEGFVAGVVVVVREVL